MSSPLEVPEVPAAPAFTVFPRLPIELRFKIWENASMAPRSLELSYRRNERKFLTLQPVPAVLHTCQESRKVGKHAYHLSFASVKNPPQTYFNPVSDIIYFGHRVFDDEVQYMLKFFGRYAQTLEEMDQIQRIALAEHLWRVDRIGSLFPPWTTGRTEEKILKFHESFPHLKELIFVAEQDESGGVDEDAEARWETYAGVSLIKCKSELSAAHQSAQETLAATFEARKKDWPDEHFPEITSMECGSYF